MRYFVSCFRAHYVLKETIIERERDYKIYHTRLLFLNTMKQKENKPKIHICSWSGGKDSMATILLALEHNEPLDRVVFAEVMFDHEKGISGEIPEHIEWIYNVAIPKLSEMGVKVDVVRAKKDYASFFVNAVGGGQIQGQTLRLSDWRHVRNQS